MNQFTPPSLFPHTKVQEPWMKDVTRLLNTAISQRVISSDDAVIAARISLFGEIIDPSVVLAFALAIAAPRGGSACVDLYTTGLDSTDKAALNEDAEKEQSAVPADRDRWVQAVSNCHKLVGSLDSSEAAPFKLADGKLYTHRYATYQSDLAERLRSMSAQDGPSLADPHLLSKGLEEFYDGLTADPTARQLLASAIACTSSLTFITGGPGMGKTWTVRYILALLIIQRSAKMAADPKVKPLRIKLVAPTGKAATRMRDAISENIRSTLTPKLTGITGEHTTPEAVTNKLLSLDAGTIHSLLGYTPKSPTSFRHNRGNPLPVDLIVIDEASMIDLALMSKLMQAIPDTAQVVILGDKNQLSSVEAGTVLSDICEGTSQAKAQLSEAKKTQLQGLGLHIDDSIEIVKAGEISGSTVTLNKNYRFVDTDRIGCFASAAVAEPYVPDEALHQLIDRVDILGESPLLAHAKRGVSKEAIEVICDGYSPYLERLMAGPLPQESQVEFHRDALKLFNKLRILCAHRMGDTGVEGLNSATIKALKKRKLIASKPNSNWIGQPILITQNDRASGRFNGDIGLVVNRTDENNNIHLMVAFPGNSDEGLEAVEYLAPIRLPNHETAFAMTIHKSQGSEFEHALIVLPTKESPILTRELIYTGVTRGKKRITILSDKKVLLEGLTKRVKRASGLAELLG